MVHHFPRRVPVDPLQDTVNAVTPVNNIQVFDDGGARVNAALLPIGGANPALKELRGLAFAGEKLYVVNGYKAYSPSLPDYPEFIFYMPTP